MLFSWLRRRRRKRLLSAPFPEEWRPWLGELPFYQGLDEEERARLHDVLRVIVAEKHWEGCKGLEVTAEMKVVIAAQAALLLLGIRHDYYRRAASILIYPSSYSHEGSGRSGEAWYRGPVILAWDHVLGGIANPEDGQNLVLHEFAHKLDMLDGVVNGTPPLGSRADYADWARVMSEAYAGLQEKVHKGRRSVMDRYGATNEAEFFAVATETFFEKPRQVARRMPELYDLFRNYYGQDPAERLRRAE